MLARAPLASILLLLTLDVLWSNAEPIGMHAFEPLSLAALEDPVAAAETLGTQLLQEQQQQQQLSLDAHVAAATDADNAASEDSQGPEEQALGGGMSVVSLVESGPGAPYVIKRTLSKDDIEDMQVEYRIQQDLADRCPKYVLRAYDWQQNESKASFRMPYARGGSLARWIRKTKERRQNHPHKVRPLLHVISKAFKCIHDSGYSHLDIKPDNFVFTWHANAFPRKPEPDQILAGVMSGVVKLIVLDFGLAVEHNKRTKGIGRRGTSDYMAKEMMLKPGLADPRMAPFTDVYGIGMVFRAIFFVVIPVEVPDDEVIEQRLREGDLPKPGELMEAIDEAPPADVVDLLTHMLDWNIKRRFNLDRVLNHSFFAGM